jgi:mannose-6-phosphate isomerase
MCRAEFDPNVAQRAEHCGIAFMADETSLVAEAARQRLTALARWENEGGACRTGNRRIGVDTHRGQAVASLLGSRRCGSSAAEPRPAPVRLLKGLPLYPLRFEPEFQYRPWGGRRLNNLLAAEVPTGSPTGEAWLLSDRDDHPSVVADGPLKGQTIRALLEQSPQQLLGQLAGRFARFPLLLKFLDVGESLSVQVHPSDVYKNFIPAGNTGKSEAWVVLENGPEARIYAGLKPAVTAELLRQAITNGTVPDQLAGFTPKLGDSVFVRAGTVHSLRDVVVFEVQQNSDVTFRLYDWDRVDPKTGRRRALQIDQAMACIDFEQGAVGPLTPLMEETHPVLRERLVHCEHFSMTRISARSPFAVGAAGMPRALVCLSGSGQLKHAASDYAFERGQVLILPAVVGACSCHPRGVVSLLELSLPNAVTTP